jgi:hypothetical protein
VWLSSSCGSTDWASANPSSSSSSSSFFDMARLGGGANNAR